MTPRFQVEGGLRLQVFLTPGVSFKILKSYLLNFTVVNYNCKIIKWGKINEYHRPPHLCIRYVKINRNFTSFFVILVV